MLENIKESTGINGSVLTAENLLYYADDIKGGTLSRPDFIRLFEKNTEIIHP